ncbi:PGR5-like protein 1B, chloroplastic [Iris pallida]|uniref:PGR5-like protein 1B, chloroplastic n=1 Tax=Iris pallida TaxID=29817 RepID=A0AAX6I8B1_IRIPA|nr:PGR5-like protein 1B, chloroplastic [Iris pallida]
MPTPSSAASTAAATTAAAAAAASPPLHVSHVRFFSARARSSSSSSDPRARSESRWRSAAAAAAEGPSCLFVGPIDTASKEMLEALYHQARYSYYNGKPLIVDDMFDKVELKLRLYGSKSVVKYPRCSLRRQSTYADAEEDPSQVVVLASVWILLLLFGSSAVLVPIVYALSQAFKDAIHSRYFLSSDRSPFDILMMLNFGLFIALGYLIGYPVASASVQALQDLLKNDLVALKGSCPNCGEEVFAFVRAEKSNLHPHSTECHVCDSSLVFRTKVEQSISSPGRRWVYGRIYLVQKTYDKSHRRM